VNRWLLYVPVSGPLGEAFGDGIVKVPTYFAMIALGATLAAWASLQAGRRAGLGRREMIDAGLFILPAGFLGARAWMVLSMPSVYLADPRRIVMGGWSWQGAMLGAALAVLLVSRLRGHDPWRVADAFASATPLGLAFGRMGCLGAGCCHGRPADWPLGVEVPWSVRYHELGHVPEALLAVPLHPSPLYEALFALGVFVALQRLHRAPPYGGAVLVGLLGGYSVGRFVLEFFRGDLERGVQTGMPFSIPQLSALATLALALALHAWRRRCTPS
jgi:phosphatidylglycerol:prolipoprotein diacylglycerol transferase